MSFFVILLIHTMFEGELMKFRINPSFLTILVSTGLVFSLSSCSGEKRKVAETSYFSQESLNEFQNLNNDSDSSTDVVMEDESFDYFSSDLSEVEKLIDENHLDAVKSKAKEIFVTGVDFIFYDGEISGVMFDELTDQGKKITMDNLKSLGEMVDTAVPGWREELSEKYQVASEFVNGVYLLVLDQIRDYLGDKNYEALGEIKDQVLGDFYDTYDSAKEHVKSWYEEVRSK